MSSKSRSRSPTRKSNTKYPRSLNRMQEKPKPFLADIIETIADAVGSKDFKSSKRSSKKKSHNLIHHGPRGGEYYVRHGRKVYISRRR
jgi:hypothetical protein